MSQIGSRNKLNQERKLVFLEAFLELSATEMTLTASAFTPEALFNSVNVNNVMVECRDCIPYDLSSNQTIELPCS